MFASRSGALWVGTRWGVFERRDASSGFQFVSPEHVWGIGEDPAGRIWTTDVAAGFRPLGAKTRPRHPQEAAGHRLVYDRQGVLWVGTFGDGLWRVRPDGGGFSIQRAALRTGLSSDSVLTIMEDCDGNVWAGTTVGLHRLTRRALTPLEGVGFVLAVLDDEAGPLAGTTKGLARLIRTGDGWRLVHVGTETPEIRTMYRDSRGVLWAGAADGLWRLVNGRLVQQPLPSRPGMLVLSIAPASGGGLWLGDGRWLYKWDGATLEPLTLPPAAGLAAISVARFDRRQRLWLGSGNAIGFLDATGSFRRLGPGDGLDPQTGLHDVIEDDDGNVWLATSKGLSRFSGDKVTTIGRAQGLPGDRVWSIVQDRDGQLWLSLDRGVVRLERREALLAMSAPSRHVRYQMFDPMDGLAGAPLGTITSTRDRNGGLWLVRGGGVTAVDPAGLTERPSYLAVRIEEAIANGQRMGLAPATLPAGTRRLEVSFSSLTLAGLKRPRFRYRLDGVDTDWVEAGPRRTVFYTNLAPREYRFRVEAHPEDGTWTTASAQWAFRIQPAFYQTPLFYALCAMAIVAAMLLAWRFRLSLVKRQFSLALAERARLSREIHDTLLQSLVGVALQFDGIANGLGPSSVGARDQLTRVRRQVEAYIRDARQSILGPAVAGARDRGSRLGAPALRQGGDRQSGDPVHVVGLRQGHAPAAQGGQPDPAHRTGSHHQCRPPFGRAPDPSRPRLRRRARRAAGVGRRVRLRPQRRRRRRRPSLRAHDHARAGRGTGRLADRHVERRRRDGHRGHRAAGGRDQAPPAGRDMSAPPPIRVLCVDDHRIVREGIALIIAREPDLSVVAMAATADEAVAEFRRHVPDVTLMDLRLGTSSGIDAVREIRREHPSARIVVLTMYRGDEDIHRALSAGAVTYLLKDALSDDLDPHGPRGARRWEPARARRQGAARRARRAPVADAARD